jgi:putative transposase
MTNHHFWLSEAQLARVEPLLPNKPPGMPRVDDLRVISRIVHVIRGGLMWRDAPAVYGPPKSLYDQFIRSSGSASSTRSSRPWGARARRRTR